MIENGTDFKCRLYIGVIFNRCIEDRECFSLQYYHSVDIAQHHIYSRVNFIPNLSICPYLVSFLVRLPLGGEWIPLLVVQVLLQVEERVEEDGSHLAPLEVPQGDLVGVGGTDHIQHLGVRVIRHYSSDFSFSLVIAQLLNINLARRLHIILLIKSDISP